MTWDPYITRTSLGLGDLSLNDDLNYKMDHPSEGWLEAIQWDRKVVTSPFYHGGFLVSAVKQLTSLNLKVFVYGSSVEAVNTKVEALLAALSQFSYEIILQKTPDLYQFTCQPADFLPDYRWMMYEENNWVVPVNIVAPASPIYSVQPGA